MTLASVACWALAHTFEAWDPPPSVLRQRFCLRCGKPNPSAKPSPAPGGLTLADGTDGALSDLAAQVSFRLPDADAAEIDALRREGETRSDVARRLVSAALRAGLGLPPEG